MISFYFITIIFIRKMLTNEFFFTLGTVQVKLKIGLQFPSIHIKSIAMGQNNGYY